MIILHFWFINYKRFIEKIQLFSQIPYKKAVFIFLSL